MIINNEIRIKYKIKREHEFYFLLSNIRENFKNYDKKENDKRKQRKNREKISLKKE